MKKPRWSTLRTRLRRISRFVALWLFCAVALLAHMVWLAGLAMDLWGAVW